MSEVPPVLPSMRLDDEIHGADAGDLVSIEARDDGGLPLLWLRTRYDIPTRYSSECVALGDDELLRLASLCIAHWRERQGRRG